MVVKHLNLEDINDVSLRLAQKLVDGGRVHTYSAIWPVPRGGVPAAYALHSALTRLMGNAAPVVSQAQLHPHQVLIVDDIYDSGRTLDPYMAAGFDCAVLFTRGRKDPTVPLAGGELYWGLNLQSVPDWLVFPWETADEASGPEANIERVLQYLGYDVHSGALVDTPRRVLSWLSEFAANQEIGSDMTTFDEVKYDEMLVIRSIPFVSLCEHHMLPFIGHATVGYIPRDKVIGLSKLARITMWTAKRLQVQERLTRQVADYVSQAVDSPDVGVVILAEHTCMTLRGAKALGSVTVTSALDGAFRDNASTRAEFLALANAR